MDGYWEDNSPEAFTATLHTYGGHWDHLIVNLECWGEVPGNSMCIPKWRFYDWLTSLVGARNTSGKIFITEDYRAAWFY